MAMEYATVTGRIVVPGTTTGIPGELRAIPLTTNGVLSFPSENYTTIGPAPAEVLADGTIEQDGTPGLKIPTDVPTGLLWQLKFYPKGKGNLPVHMGFYEIPTSADIADLVAVELAEITDETMATIAAAAALGATNDTATASFLNDTGSASRAAFQAALATDVPAVEAFDRRAPGVRNRQVVGVIRKTAGVWAPIDDAAHTPTGITSVVADTSKIRINFDHTAVKVGSLVPATDETYAAEGYHMGFSVAEEWADLFIYKRVGPVAGYVNYNGSAWVSSAHLGVDHFRNFSFSGNTLYMEHDSVKPAADNLMVWVVGRGSGAYHYTIGSISATITRVEIWKPTVSGSNVVYTAVTTPASDMKFYVGRASDGMAAVDPTTMPEGMSNIWLVGQNEVTPPS